MANLMLLEMKRTKNPKIYNFIQKITQYLEGEGFSIIDDSMNNRIIYMTMKSMSQIKTTNYIKTIKNTTDYSLAVKEIYTTTNLIKQ